MIGMIHFSVSVMSMLVVSSVLAGPLHDAATEGNFAQVKRLLDKGHHVNSSDENGRTPLHFAVANGHLDVAFLLLGHRARFNLQSVNTGVTLQETNIDGRWKGVEEKFCPGSPQPASDVTVQIELRQSEHQVTIAYISSGGRVPGNCTLEGKGFMCKLQRTQRSKPSYGGNVITTRISGHEVCIINNEESISCAGNTFYNGRFACFSKIRQLSRSP